VVFQNYSQTHSELLKTIIFPKNNWSSLKSKLPEPRYTEVIGDAYTHSEKQNYNGKNLSSQQTKDTQSATQSVPKQRSVADSIRMKNHESQSKEGQIANPIISKDLKKIL